MDVISIHVPKTAGSTFGKILNAIYGESRVQIDYDDFVMNPTSLYNVDRSAWNIQAAEQVAAIGPEIRAVHGHVVVEKYRKAFPQAHWVAWVRHPASWVISLYYYWKHWPEYHLPFANPLIRRLKAEQLSLIEFAEDPTIRDRVSRLFLQGMPLDTFSFVGIQEHFENDLRFLARMMNWPEIQVSSVNKSPEPGYAEIFRAHHEDRDLIDRLIALNQGDMALYEEALKLRSSRVREWPTVSRPQAGRMALATGC